MNHTYEEIRNATLDILAGRETSSYDSSQYSHLLIGVAEVFQRREGTRPAQHSILSSGEGRLSAPDAELFLEVFWDLFRHGIITLGCNDSNREFPFFRVSSFGRRILEEHQAYFFHDVSSYTKLLTDAVPNLDPVTLLYLQESMQAFKAGCLLSSSVMLGVAAEHTFLLLIEAIEQNPTHSSTFAAVSKLRMILPKLNKFKSILDQQLTSLPAEIKEDLDTHFAGIMSIIRNFRNQSGHPSGHLIDREQAYILLQLFVPYCKKMYQLKAFYS